MALMISVSGIRGIFGPDLNPENLASFTAGFGAWVEGGTVVVGRDSRVTGELCEQIVTATLSAMGCKVIKTGIVPTPTVAMAVLKHKAAGGIIISASHNPEEWNALKLLNSKSEFLTAEEGEAVIEASGMQNKPYKKYDEIGKIISDDQALQHHIDEILKLSFIDRELIASKNFSVAVDAVNGAGSESVPALLKALGVSKVECLNCEPTGIFPHNPEPLPKHLTDICDFVKEKKSDIGFVTDPDADRLVIVDETGSLFGEEYTQASVFEYILSKKDGPCVTNLASSRVADDVARKHGQECYRSAVGEINVVKKMQANNAVIGGEGSGGVICPDLHYGRDALVGIAIVLQALAEKNMTASSYRNLFTDYFMSKNKIQLDELGKSADEVMDFVAEHYDNLNPNLEDGVKIDFAEGWVHLRKSNTEPIIRIYSEGKTQEAAEGFANKIKQLL